MQTRLVYLKKKEHLFSILKKRTNTILTPHEGEFKRLFGEIKKDKVSAALLASKKLILQLFLKVMILL